MADGGIKVNEKAGIENGGDWLARYEDIMKKGAWESVAMAQLTLETQRIANLAKCYQGFTGMIRSGAQGFSQLS